MEGGLSPFMLRAKEREKFELTGIERRRNKQDLLQTKRENGGARRERFVPLAKRTDLRGGGKKGMTKRQRPSLANADKKGRY